MYGSEMNFSASLRFKGASLEMTLEGGEGETETDFIQRSSDAFRSLEYEAKAGFKKEYGHGGHFRQPTPEPVTEPVIEAPAAPISDPLGGEDE